MKEEVLNHYKEFSPYTYPGLYHNYFLSLPNDVKELGELVCSQVIHPITLHMCQPEYFHLYGDLRKYPKYRLINEDDVFQTAVAMTAELFRMDERGFTTERNVEDKIVVTCRYVSVLMNAILKSKKIPCRSRAGFFQYWPNSSDTCDHWINEYWNEQENRWIAFDADGFYQFEEKLGFSQYDIPRDKFAWAAEVWLKIRQGKVQGNYYKYADNKGTNGLSATVRQLFYDFHSLMNNEISYNCLPSFVYNNERFIKLTESDLQELDTLATLLLDPDHNFKELKALWENVDKYRIMCSPLIEDLESLKNH